MIGQEIIYAPCPCGSGKKFKFCCYTKYRDMLEDDMTPAEVAQLVRCESRGVYDESTHDARAWKLHDDGIELMRGRKLKEAQVKFHAAREIDPAFRSCWNNEASCAWHLNDWRAAYEIQKEGLSHDCDSNVFSLAALARYALAVGRPDEAEEALAKALAPLPLAVDEALEVCKSLALLHRHREILDYAARSGMGDSPRIAFFTGVAHANLGETADAWTDLNKAQDSEFETTAYDYCCYLEDKRMPMSLGIEDWPYFSHYSFPPADLFLDDLDEERDPLKSCPAPFALDCINILAAEDLCMRKDLRQALSRIKGRDAEAMLDKLDQFDRAAREAEEEAEREAEENAAAREEDLDANGCPRQPFTLASEIQREKDELTDEQVDILDEALALLDDNSSPDDPNFLQAENALANIAREHPDSALINLSYFQMLYQHDKALAEGLVESFCAARPTQISCAETLMIKAISRQDYARAYALLDRFSVPLLPLKKEHCLSWSFILSELIDPARKERHPDGFAYALRFTNALFPDLVDKVLNARASRK